MKLELSKKEKTFFGFLFIGIFFFAIGYSSQGQFNLPLAWVLGLNGESVDSDNNGQVDMADDSEKLGGLDSGDFLSAASSNTGGGGVFTLVGREESSGSGTGIPYCPSGYTTTPGYWNCPNNAGDCFCGEQSGYNYYVSYSSFQTSNGYYVRCSICTPTTSSSSTGDVTDKDGDDIDDYDSIAYKNKYLGPDGDLIGIDLSPGIRDDSASNSGTILFKTTNTIIGNSIQNNRAGVDSFCQNNKPSELQCNNIHSFFSVSSSDSIKRMPINYNYNPYRALYYYRAKNLYKIGNDWNDVLDGNVGNFVDSFVWWSNSYSNGDFYQSSVFYAGNTGYSSTIWIQYSTYSITSSFPLLCACTP